MSWKRNVLVLANLTASSDEILDALCARAESGPHVFTLVVPAPPSGAEGAAARLRAALDGARSRGLEIEGQLADDDPCVAAVEAWDPAKYDEIIVCTLPPGASRWLGADLPHRIERATGALVSHVVAHMPAPERHYVHRERGPDPGVLRPLSVLTWGRTHPPASPHEAPAASQ